MIVEFKKPWSKYGELIFFIISDVLLLYEWNLEKWSSRHCKEHNIWEQFLQRNIEIKYVLTIETFHWKIFIYINKVF